MARSSTFPFRLKRAHKGTLERYAGLAVFAQNQANILVTSVGSSSVLFPVSDVCWSSVGSEEKEFGEIANDSIMLTCSVNASFLLPALELTQW